VVPGMRAIRRTALNSETKNSFAQDV